MLPTLMTVQHARPLALPPPSGEPALALELVELELSLDGFATEQDGFSEAVHRGAKALGGEFLFDLPASGLAIAASTASPSWFTKGMSLIAWPPSASGC